MNWNQIKVKLRMGWGKWMRGRNRCGLDSNALILTSGGMPAESSPESPPELEFRHGENEEH